MASCNQKEMIAQARQAHTLLEDLHDLEIEMLCKRADRVLASIWGCGVEQRYIQVWVWQVSREMTQAVSREGRDVEDMSKLVTKFALPTPEEYTLSQVRCYKIL